MLYCHKGSKAQSFFKINLYFQHFVFPRPNDYFGMLGGLGVLEANVKLTLIRRYRLPRPPSSGSQ
jgi:hypothetical protein